MGNTIDVTFGALREAAVGGGWKLRVVRRTPDGLIGDLIGPEPYDLLAWTYNHPHGIGARYKPAAILRANEMGISLPVLPGAGLPAAVDRHILWSVIDQTQGE